MARRPMVQKLCFSTQMASFDVLTLCAVNLAHNYDVVTQLQTFHNRNAAGSRLEGE